MPTHQHGGSTLLIFCELTFIEHAAISINIKINGFFIVIMLLMLNKKG